MNKEYGNHPALRSDEPEVLEPEIMGHAPQAPLWRRLAARAAISLFLGLLGLGLSLMGVVLTITLVGAMVGIPLLFIGLGLMSLSVFLFFAAAKTRIVSLEI